MSELLGLRRHLYEQLAAARPASRRRRTLRRQLRLLGRAGGGPDGGGPAGVREPRRPSPAGGPARRALRSG